MGINITKPLRIRNISLGEGMPKICVPIVGVTQEDICEEARQVIALCSNICGEDKSIALLQSGDLLPVDIVEWRVDWYEDSKQIDKVIDTARKLRAILGEIPILFTIRTSAEGGETVYTDQEYARINKKIAESGIVDMVDVELFIGGDVVGEIIDSVHQSGVYVIASNHDFHATPSKEELITRLTRMDTMGADVLKIAVMPENTSDVLHLLDVTREMVEEKTDKPVVTMSMGALGVISRVSGGTFGSAMTFGSGAKASAPGQIEARKLKDMLVELGRADSV